MIVETYRARSPALVSAGRSPSDIARLKRWRIAAWPAARREASSRRISWSDGDALVDDGRWRGRGAGEPPSSSLGLGGGGGGDREDDGKLSGLVSAWALTGRLRSVTSYGNSFW